MEAPRGPAGTTPGAHTAFTERHQDPSHAACPAAAHAQGAPDDLDQPEQPSGAPVNATPITIIDPAPKPGRSARPKPPATGFGAIRRPRRGLAALRGIQGARRLVQLAVLAIVGVVLAGRWAAAAEGGSTTSAEALCPFGGLETLFTWVTTGAFVPHVHASNVVLAIAVLVLALLARGAFCGWICPLGFLQDLAAGLSALVQRRVPAAHRAMRAIHRAAAPLAVLDRPLRLFRYIVLAWAIGGAAAFGVMVFRDVDPWNALLEVGTGSLGFGLVVLVATLVGSLFTDRPWCRYACPLGAANGLVAKLSPIRLERNQSACVDCNLCTRSCPMGIDVARETVVTSTACTGCLECVEACPRAGALELHAGLPIGGRA